MLSVRLVIERSRQPLARFWRGADAAFGSCRCRAFNHRYMRQHRIAAMFGDQHQDSTNRGPRIAPGPPDCRWRTSGQQPPFATSHLLLEQIATSPRLNSGTRCLKLGAPDYPPKRQEAISVGGPFHFPSTVFLGHRAFMCSTAATSYPPVRWSSILLATSSQTAAKSRSSCFIDGSSAVSASCRNFAASSRR